MPGPSSRPRTERGASHRVTVRVLLRRRPTRRGRAATTRWKSRKVRLVTTGSRRCGACPPPSSVTSRACGIAAATAAPRSGPTTASCDPRTTTVGQRTFEHSRTAVGLSLGQSASKPRRMVCGSVCVPHPTASSNLFGRVWLGERLSEEELEEPGQSRSDDDTKSIRSLPRHQRFVQQAHSCNDRSRARRYPPRRMSTHAASWAETRASRRTYRIAPWAGVTDGGAPESALGRASAHLGVDHHCNLSGAHTAVDLYGSNREGGERLRTQMKRYAPARGRPRNRVADRLRLESASIRRCFPCCPARFVVQHGRWPPSRSSG
jgi:hypothetical protein